MHKVVIVNLHLLPNEIRICTDVLSSSLADVYRCSKMLFCIFLNFYRLLLKKAAAVIGVYRLVQQVTLKIARASICEKFSSLICSGNNAFWLLVRRIATDFLVWMLSGVLPTFYLRLCNRLMVAMVIWWLNIYLSDTLQRRDLKCSWLGHKSDIDDSNISYYAAGEPQIMWSL